MKSREHLAIRGAVQGVGFRPFVYRLARDLGLNGWVSNTPSGVFIEVEGGTMQLVEFRRRLETEKPPISFIQSLEATVLDPAGYDRFEIRESGESGERLAVILPDAAVCPDCLREIRDPANRRYRYPFTNCTHCGPRFSIIEALPYDRRNTSMKRFAMCPECNDEYVNPENRRFHAQPNACPVCGPQLALWNAHGDTIEVRDDALLSAAAALRSGKIVAVKGIGGFHLMADAGNEEAVSTLRRRKHREEKPLALMLGSIVKIRDLCDVSPLEERLLTSIAAPIVLLRKRSRAGSTGIKVAPSVAPGNPSLGILLPYSPLHHLLLDASETPLVATSGNLSEEPICIDEREALHRLQGIADFFLVHDRPIVRHVDDSVARVVAGRELVLRRARGFAPLPVSGSDRSVSSFMAVGGHLKNTIAVSVAEDIFVSQHLGDLSSKESYDAFVSVGEDLTRLYDVRPAVTVSDKHPDYRSTQFAGGRGGKQVSVQHHLAHVASCMAENRLRGPVLGVSWDGTGYGDDGTIWGGEFLIASEDGYRRAAHLRTFRLPGGEAAVTEPARSAIGALYELLGDSLFQRNDLHPLKGFSSAELLLLSQMLAKDIHCPVTSSAGRLFDAVAGLIGIRSRVRYEGQAAMELEWLIGETCTEDAYGFHLSAEASSIVVDWGEALLQLVEDVSSGTAASIVSAKFHNMLTDAIVKVAKEAGEERVVLTGGCFQNVYLLERTIAKLRENGFSPYWHQRIPPNDGGISLGQIYAAQRILKAHETDEVEPVVNESLT